jgi:hypothetical protein
MTPRTNGSRPGWRDVYELVQDSSTRIEGKIDQIDVRVRRLEDSALVESGKRKGEARILGLARSTLAILIAVSAALVNLLPHIGGFVSQILR